MKIAVLTGGGDCPGLNAAIRAVVRKAKSLNYDCVGVERGWLGLIERSIKPLNARSVSGILPIGGTILGTSRTNPMKVEDGFLKIRKTLEEEKIDAIVAIGGDDTLGVASELHKQNMPVVGVPKTIDNDVAGTDYCIGFDSAVTIVSDAIDKLHTTASAHHRVMVVEVMGRDAGWVALVGGLSGGADWILIPEVPASIDEICKHLHKRKSHGKDFSIIVVAEGVSISEISLEGERENVDAFGHARLDRRGIGDRISKEIERRTGFESRVTILGHLQRGGSPTVFDRVLATRLGVAAVESIQHKRYGKMVGLQANQIVDVPLDEAIKHSPRLVDLKLYELARLFY